MSSTPANVCIFTDEVKRQQHRWWLVLLHWLVCSLAFVAVATQLLKNVPDAVVTRVDRVSPNIALYELDRCPHINAVSFGRLHAKRRFCNTSILACMRCAGASREEV